MNIGNAIKEIRQRYGWSQSDLSEKTGIAQTHLSQIESDSKNASRTTIEKICKAFQIPEAVLYALGMDLNDTTSAKKDVFKELYPAMKEFALQLLDKKKATIISNKPKK